LRKGILYLIPSPLGDSALLETMPAFNLELVKRLIHFVAEDAKTARRFLKRCGYADLQQAQLTLLNEHSKTGETIHLLAPLLQGHDVGLMSDAGCPGIADPGVDLIALAHQKGIEIRPLTGPSSIVLTIMASGFNGQNFAFTGYLPIDKPLRTKRVKELEQLAYRQKQAQFFIETPYRNNQLFADLLNTLQASTRLCIAKQITEPQQRIQSLSVEEWKKKTVDLHKVPVVFGIYVA
jgi:16S rRNA (cytidine1402-2'-O)-methyltransferase